MSSIIRRRSGLISVIVISCSASWANTQSFKTEEHHANPTLQMPRQRLRSIMSDDPKKTGQDRKLVSNQEYEIAYVRKTAGVTRQKAKQAIDKAGPSREKVMAYLKDLK